MRRSLIVLPLVAMAIVMSGCTAMMNSSYYGASDLYRTNNRAEVAVQLKAKAEADAELYRRQQEAQKTHRILLHSFFPFLKK